MGTIRAPTAMIYLLIVIIAGLLLDLNGMIITTALCSLLVAGLIIAGNAGLLPLPDYSLTKTQWITFTAILGWAGSLTHLTLQHLNRALARADNELAERKSSDAELAKHRDHLEELIKERTIELEEKNSLLTGEITERKRVEEALRTSESFLNSIIDQSPLPIWISDEKGTLIRINQACQDLLHISEEEILGKYNIFEDNIVEEQGFMPLVRSVFEDCETARFEINYDSSKVNDLRLANHASVTLVVTIFPSGTHEGRLSMQ